MLQYEPVSLRRRAATRELYEKARKGDMDAAKELVQQNRKGGLEVHQQRITKATIKAMLERRANGRARPQKAHLRVEVLG